MKPQAELPAAARARARTSVRRGFWEAVLMARGLCPSNTRKRAGRFLFAFGSQKSNPSKMQAQHHHSNQCRFHSIRQYIHWIQETQEFSHPQVRRQRARSFLSVSAAPSWLRCRNAAVELPRRSAKPSKDRENVPNVPTPSRQRTAQRSRRSLPRSVPPVEA